MTKRLLQLLPLTLLAIVTTNLQAQARLAIYGTAGAEQSGLPYNPWKLAGTFGLYVQFFKLGPVFISVDGRGDLLQPDSQRSRWPSTRHQTPVLPIRPYGEILFGVANYPQTAGGIQYSNDFAYRYVLGVDSTILPHLDWRVVDFSYGINNSAGYGHAETVTSGLVIRF